MFANYRKFGRDRERNRPRAARPRPGLVAEALESRQLMAYSPFYNSLPQLAVSGYAAPSASPGGTLAVDVIVQNLGASSLIEPTALAPGALSSADVLTTDVEIYASATANAKSGYVLLGSLTTPEIRQNTDYETVTNVTLPTSIKGFAGNKFYLTLVVNGNRSVVEETNAGDVYHVPNPVTIVRSPLPDLQVVGFDIPQPLRPGDVVAPTIEIENFGTGDVAAQGGVTVDLVASLDKKFGAGDAIASTFTIPSLPGISGVPTQTTLANAANLVPTSNIDTITLPAFQLPTTPGFYYLGIKIDPNHLINQTYGANSNLSDVTPVGPANGLLPAATVLATATSATFPELPVTTVNTTGALTTPVITPLAISIDGTVVATAVASPVSAEAFKKAHHKR